MSGWIKYHRSIENWEWYDDAYTLKLFLYIISNANIEDKRWKGIEIKRGQLVTSLDKLSERTHMSKKRVYKRLNDLVSSGEVTKEGTAFTLITVCKYETYQDNGKPKETERKHKGNRKETERETTKEVKNKRSKEKVIPTKKELIEFVTIEKGRKDIDLDGLWNKVDGWILNDWKDGYNKPIMKWKSKVINQFKYFKTDNQNLNKNKSAAEILQEKYGIS